jgi:hypothetical protein
MSNKEKVVSNKFFIKTTVLVALFLFLIPSVLYAQTITKSFPDKVASRFSDYEIIGKNDLGLVVHFFGTNESELVTYDDKLKIANRRDLPFKGKAATLESFILLQNKILAFYTTNGENYQYFKLKILDEKLTIPNETIFAGFHAINEYWKKAKHFM